MSSAVIMKRKCEEFYGERRGSIPNPGLTKIDFKLKFTRLVQILFL